MPTQSTAWINARIQALLNQLQPLQTAASAVMFAELRALTELRLQSTPEPVSTPAVAPGINLSKVRHPSEAVILILREANAPLTRREIVKRAEAGGWMGEGDSPRRINQAITGFLEDTEHRGKAWSALFYREDDGYTGRFINENRIGLLEWKRKLQGETNGDGPAH